MARFKSVINVATGQAERVPLTASEETQRDTEDAQNQIDCPQNYSLAGAKTHKIKAVRREAKALYVDHVDPHYNQRGREVAEGGNYNVPANVKSFVASLKADFITMKAEINAKSTMQDVKDYSPGRDGAKAWPTPPGA